MENRSDGGWAVAAICVVAILLLLVGGSGAAIFYVLRQQQLELALRTDQIAMAEAEARVQAELARAQADITVKTLRASSSEDSADADVDSTRLAIETILREQEDAWNRGDLDAFMEHYWQSDALTFSSGGKTARGWTETLQRYRERYPTREAMGNLTLSDLEITPLGDSAALVLGRWSIRRESEPVSGNFSLVVRKFDNHWLIVHDHTSRTMEQAAPGPEHDQPM